MPKTLRENPTRLYAVIREQGRSYQWLSRKSGYSAQHIGAVARGEKEGTLPFYRLMSACLGEDVYVKGEPVGEVSIS